MLVQFYRFDIMNKYTNNRFPIERLASIFLKVENKSKMEK